MTQEIKKCKVVPLLNVVCFPSLPINCNIGREITKNSIKEAFQNGEEIVFVTQTTDVLTNDLLSCVNPVGCLCKIKQITMDKGAGTLLKVVAEGVQKVKILSVVEGEQYLTCEIETVQEVSTDMMEINMLLSACKEKFVEYASVNSKIGNDLVRLLGDFQDANGFVDGVAVIALKSEEDQLALLNEFDTAKRLEKLIVFLNKEIEVANLNERINTKVRESMDKNQKEYYLREQMKAISSELGEDEDEFDAIETKIKNGKMPKEVQEKALKELSRCRKIPSASPDYSVLRNYLDVLLELPWGEYTQDNKDLVKAREILDEDHSGLDKIKDRIIEHLAVMQLTNKVNGQIICFVGPPGVGKTSVAKSIARALNRHFVKMSVGGVKDESEIRGHRKTYVGAMSGRIIYNMKMAKSMNPVFLIDEIDKMSSDYKGDPTSAMLEVLDPEQNYCFRDNFLEVPFDLSKVMFICTANDRSLIPAPLQDRMEIIELSSYTLTEKFAIAKDHIIPKEMKAHGIEKDQLIIPDEIIKKIIEEYTYEAGVRGLERDIATICRKVDVKIVNNTTNEKVVVKLTNENLKDFLGAHKIIRDEMRDTAEVGVISGMSYSTVGGGVLNIEVNKVDGEGKIVLTGQLGDVMQESCKVALSAITCIAEEYGLKGEDFKHKDIHIHVPEGAVKKDGPSAGGALATAIYSSFANKKINNNLAMTGEITIRGNILAIGGLKEKLFACCRAGIKNVFVPKQNEDDVEELPKDITSNLNIQYVSNIREVLNNKITFVE